MLIRELKTLIYKEILLEWRERYALNGIILYLVSTIFVCYLSFSVKTKLIAPITWNTLFWIILLFTSINSIGKSFMLERSERQLYYYSLVSPLSVILSKIIYNILLNVFISTIGLGVYFILLGNPVQNIYLFILNIFLGSVGFAATFTMVSGIASKAENSHTLMAILSFPIIIPMLLMLIKISQNALDGLDNRVSLDELSTLISINFIVFTLSLLLFPYLWRS